MTEAVAVRKKRDYSKRKKRDHGFFKFQDPERMSMKNLRGQLCEAAGRHGENCGMCGLCNYGRVWTRRNAAV